MLFLSPRPPPDGAVLSSDTDDWFWNASSTNEKTWAIDSEIQTELYYTLTKMEWKPFINIKLTYKTWVRYFNRLRYFSINLSKIYITLVLKQSMSFETG